MLLAFALNPDLHAGMTCKTLALAAQQTFSHLGQLLGDPCPGLCFWASGNAAEYCHCSWGHTQLPPKLVTDPASLRVQPGHLRGLLCAWTASEPLAACRCQTCVRLARGLVSHLQASALPAVTLLCTSIPGLTRGSARTGIKPELLVSLLRRFGLSAPASASHELVFSYKMHDFILAAWAEELRKGPASPAQAASEAAWAAAVLTEPPARPPSSYREKQAVTAVGKARLSAAFETRAAMQQAVLAHRQARPPAA